MDYSTLLCFILLNTLVAALPKGTFQNDHQSLEKDDSDEIVSSVADEDFRTNLITNRPMTKYEVTEIVIDIPDDRTKAPILTNFTIPRPLNTVLTTDINSENINKTDLNEATEKVTIFTDKDNEGKKNYVSIFHVKAEFEDKTEKTTPVVVELHHVPHISGIKEYFNGIKQGIVNGFNSIIHKHKEHEEFDGPLTFLSKLHKKSTAAAHKIHDAVFGHTRDDLD